MARVISFSQQNRYIKEKLKDRCARWNPQKTVLEWIVNIDSRNHRGKRDKFLQDQYDKILHIEDKAQSE